MLLKLAALGALTYVGYRYFEKSQSLQTQPAFARSEGDAAIRDAGPEAMRDEPAEPWSTTDQAIDESFPASDPPANY